MHLFGVTLAAWGLVAAGAEGEAHRERLAALVFWGGIAVAVMSKGLPGLLFPVALLVVWRLSHSESRLLWRLIDWPAALLAIVLVVPWHLAAAARIPGFFQFYLWDNQVLRFLGQRQYVEDGTGLSTPAFLGMTMFVLLPWTPLLGAGVHRALQPTGRNPQRAFLLGWVVVVIGLFSLSAFKLEYYALPAFPAAALLVASLLDEAAEAKGATLLALLRSWTLAALVCGVVYALLLAWAVTTRTFTPAAIVRGLAFWSTNYRVILEQGLPLPAVSPLAVEMILIGGALLWLLGPIGVLGFLRHRLVVAAAVSVGVVGLCLCLLASAAWRLVGPHHSLRPLAARVLAEARADDTLVHERGMEKGGGLLFYTGRRSLVLNGRRGDLDFGSRLPGFRQAFITTPGFQALWSGPGRVFLVTDLPVLRSAISAVAPAPILLAATPTRWLYANR
jgi:4-amino-4-deoxy-L-arabinose transferase-like glycosyltransferase